jgi:ubiquinone/menaquinone biosynthesis C-methylase UbiE
MKLLARLIYNLIYICLQKTWKLNPFIPKKLNNREIRWGHARTEQETNPHLDKEIIKQLHEFGIKHSAYRIDLAGFNKYLSAAQYPLSYYGGRNLKAERIEKSLEHFASLILLNLNKESVVVDAGAGTSPFYKIAAELSGSKKVYRQDKQFASGLNGYTIGGSASKFPLPDASVDAISLHCSLEHFENKEDVNFFVEAQRVLKPGGKCVILPFYLSSRYTVHLDPVKNFLNFSTPNVRYDSNAQIRYCDSRQRFSRHYDVKTFKERILNQLKKVELEIFFVENFKEVHHDCYLRFIAVFTKI